MLSGINTNAAALSICVTQTDGLIHVRRKRVATGSVEVAYF